MARKTQPVKKLAASPMQDLVDGAPIVEPEPPTPWRNRIVGHDVVDGSTLIANPRNWRIHPDNQRDAMSGVLDEVGWVQQVIVNKRTGCVVDGHLRAELAIARGEPVPVVYVDLDEEEEAKILASLDPLSTMAVTDSGALEALLMNMETENETLDALLHSMVDQADLASLDNVAAEMKTKSHGRLIGGDKKAQIKAVMYSNQIGVFETALKATGLLNRGDALMTVCRFYLESEEKRQLDIPVQTKPAKTGTARA